jgi:hypothetical protein
MMSYAVNRNPLLVGSAKTAFGGRMGNGMIKTILLVLVAGALGGLSSGILVWGMGALGVTPALGFNMVPKFSVDWISRRIIASAIWGLVFLIPICRNAPILKGAILGILPWLSSIFYVLPYVKSVGFLGLELGNGTPLWTLFFGCFWGVTGTLFLARVTRKI